jgi:hypothetical protein
MSITAPYFPDDLSSDDLQDLVERVIREIKKGPEPAAPTSSAAPSLFAVPEPDQVAASTDTIPKLGKGPLLGATAKLDMRWSAGGYAFITKDDISPTQLDAYWQANRRELEASCDWASRFTNDPIMERTAVAAAHLRFSRVNGRESAEAFLYPLGTMIGLKRGTPQHTLLKKLMNHNDLLQHGKTDKKLGNEDIVTMLTHLYVKHLKGKNVSKIGWPDDWTTPPIPRIAA